MPRVVMIILEKTLTLSPGSGNLSPSPNYFLIPKSILLPSGDFNISFDDLSGTCTVSYLDPSSP